MLNIPFFLFSRHGETDWNAEARWQGGTDIPLNEKGRSQARGNALRLKALLHENGLDAKTLPIITSPLSRARETAEILATGIGRAPESLVLEPALKEFSFGVWEGKSIYEAEAEFADLHQERIRSPWHFKCHGGESYNCLMLRVSPILAALKEPALIVSHGGVLRVLYHLFSGIERDDVHIQPIRQDVIYHVSPKMVREI